jgi:hypothetical protein
MYSTIHGAGRVMGRRKATGHIDRKTGEVKRVPKITREMMDSKVIEACVELRGADVDESPHCYKRLDQVWRLTAARCGFSIRSLPLVLPWRARMSSILTRIEHQQGTASAVPSFLTA